MTDYINSKEKRPKFLNLLKISMPITAIASILHRISGLLLFLMLPVTIYALGLSLKNADGFLTVLAFVDHSVIQLVFIFLSVALFYHSLAGIRFLFMDLNIGQNLKRARGSAWLVIGLSLLLAVALLNRILMS